MSLCRRSGRSPPSKVVMSLKLCRGMLYASTLPISLHFFVYLHNASLFNSLENIIRYVYTVYNISCHPIMFQYERLLGFHLGIDPVCLHLQFGTASRQQRYGRSLVTSMHTIYMSNKKSLHKNNNIYSGR